MWVKDTIKSRKLLPEITPDFLTAGNVGQQCLDSRNLLVCAVTAVFMITTRVSANVSKQWGISLILLHRYVASPPLTIFGAVKPVLIYPRSNGNLFSFKSISDPECRKWEKYRVICNEEMPLENQRRRKKNYLTFGILLGFFLWLILIRTAFRRICHRRDLWCYNEESIKFYCKQNVYYQYYSCHHELYRRRLPKL
jgi:hypothetical protein